MRLLPHIPPEHLGQARRALLESGAIDTGLLDDTLARSWHRCRHAGLQPLQRPAESARCDGDDLRRALAEQRDFLAHARPVMNFLYDQMRDSGSLVVLADARGLLLHTLGDADFVSRAERVALMPGAIWGERERGTNAIGTALEDGRPTWIHGGEHYLERNGFLTCAAAPVSDSSGRLLGVVDISGDHRGQHPHTFALVRSAARMIEQRLFEARHLQHVRLRLHPLAEGLGTPGEGLVAATEDGWVVGANAMALDWLGLQPTDLGGLRVEQVFGRPLVTLLDTSARLGGRPARLSLPRRIQVSQTAGAPGGSGRPPAELYVRAEPEQRSAPLCTPKAAATDLRAACSPPRWPQVAARLHAPPAADPPCLDPDLAAARMRARRALAHALPLLLQGESGSGKEVFAKDLHACGPRPAGPFVAVNCAALPDTLIEAELFGYVGGAYTGARREGAPGRIREAEGGTLFLDEIGDMPLPLQARLLRVLQERSVTPLGGGKPQPVDFLLVCATHRNLRDEIAAGRFREDLYYRINGLTLLLPPLRERKDFSQIVAGMLAAACPGREVRLSTEVEAALKHYRWPGNLRQLRNVLLAACAMLEDDEQTLCWAHLPDDLRQELAGPPPTSPGAQGPAVADANLRRLSYRAIAQVMETTGGNLSETARRLGISRNTLYRRLRRGE